MKRYLLAMLGIIVVSNLFVLSKVYFNRYTGEKAQVELSERELSIPYSYGLNKEDTSIKLRLKWRTTSASDEYWFNNRMQVSYEKMMELGFEPRKTNTDEQYYRQLKKEVYWLMEFNGKTYQSVVKKLEEKIEAEKNKLCDNCKDKQKAKDLIESLKEERELRSRLFVVDISQNRSSLENSIQNANQFVVKGIVKPGYFFDKTKNDLAQEKQYINLVRVLSGEIYVPLQFSKNLKPALENSRTNREVKFSVSTSWGSALEPWITKLSLVND